MGVDPCERFLCEIHVGLAQRAKGYDVFREAEDFQRLFVVLHQHEVVIRINRCICMGCVPDVSDLLAPLYLPGTSPLELVADHIMANEWLDGVLANCRRVTDQLLTLVKREGRVEVHVASG